jgi:hypothetical protein
MIGWDIRLIGGRCPAVAVWDARKDHERLSEATMILAGIA